MGAPDDSPSLALNFSLNEHDHEWQLIHSTYADARRFMEAQARQCPQARRMFAALKSQRRRRAASRAGTALSLSVWLLPRAP